MLSLASRYCVLEMEARLGASDLKRTRGNGQMQTGEAHPEPLNGLLNTVAKFEVSRLNQGQPLYHRVAVELH